MDFRYSLDPSPKKHICPACTKKRFVRYIDITTGEYHPDTTCGRCDRASKCNYQRIPSMGNPIYRVDFLMMQTITHKAYKLTEKNYRVHIVPKSVVKELGSEYAYITEWFLDGSTLPKTGEPKYFDGDNAILTAIEPQEVKLPSYHPLEILEQTAPDNLTRWLLTKFSPKEVKTAIAKYNLTGINNPWQASTVFWQIDNEGKVRGGKVLKYDPETGSRIKNPKPLITWIHSILKAQDFNLVQCLYGLNLINERPGAEIGIVESEKTAIYMSIKEPNKVWLSCGSVSGLKPQLLEPIKVHRITAYPDKGCFEAWKSKSEAMNANGYNITVNNALEAEDLPDGSDLLDYYELNKI